MGLLKIIFIIFVLIFPLGEIARFEFGNGIAIRLNEVILTLLVLFWIALHFLRRKTIRGLLIKPIFIFIGICLLSLLLNMNNLLFSQFLTSFLYLLRWILYACIYFMVLDFDSKFKQRIPIFMVISGTITLFIGFIQYFFYSSLRNLYYLGWDEHLYRLFSSFLDPNFAGSFFVLFFIFISGLFFNYSRKSNKKKIFLICILGLFILTAIFLTYSRSAFLMLLISVFIFLTIKNKKKWIFALIGFSILIFAISSKNFYIENLNLFRIASSEARIESASNAIKIIKDNSIFGVGFNAYRYAQVRYGFRDNKSSLLSHADAGTDNSFLFVFATAGVFGFFAYLYLLFRIVSISFRKSRKEKPGFNKTISIVVLSSFIGLFINALFINSLFYVFIMEWMWILIGLKENN